MKTGRNFVTNSVLLRNGWQPTINNDPHNDNLMRTLQTTGRITNIDLGDHTLPSQLAVETAMRDAGVLRGRPQVDFTTTCVIPNSPKDK